MSILTHDQFPSTEKKGIAHVSASRPGEAVQVGPNVEQCPLIVPEAESLACRMTDSVRSCVHR